MYAKNAILFLLFLLLNASGYRVAVSAPWKDKSSSVKPFPFQQEGYISQLDSALLQGKPVFIDFYTSWCGPCKVMDRDVFTDPSLIRYFTQHYQNLKVNAELGEGIVLAQKFGIKAYPTLLFLDGSGQEQKRLVGITTASRLLSVGKTVAGK
jgi:thiol:disulfide interchange protein